MRVVLREDVETLGKKGDLLEVADGYARNYLVPRGLAMRATKGVVAQSESMRRSREVKETRDREAAQKVAAQLGSQTIQVKARAGEGGKLFGSVTAADVADAVLSQTGIEFIVRRAMSFQAAMLLMSIYYLLDERDRKGMRSINHDLQELRDAGCVSLQRHGKLTKFIINRERVIELASETEARVDRWLDGEGETAD